MLKRYNNIEKSQGFTLIELMVTIAIVGLLVVIVLVAFSGQTDKARIAKTLQWSRSVEHLLGADAVGIWTFDEGSGATAIDSSGYGNDGTIYGASYTTDTPSGYGYALEFNGTSDYVNVGGSNILKPKNEITIGIWTKLVSLDDLWSPFLLGGDGVDASYWADIGYILWKTSDELDFALVDGNGQTQRLRGVYLSEYENKWVYLTAVYDGEKQYIYVNGDIKNNREYTGGINYQRTNNFRVQVGGKNYSYNWYDGLIDDVRIYETALTFVQVEALYYVGLDNLYNKGLIDEQEHKERILANNK
jgi:prepilin-type N-terminal cleavage/methylation domain-containing protein